MAWGAGSLEKASPLPLPVLKENRDEYINRLQAIRDEGAWEDWLAFFLDGIAQVASEATQRATEILELRERDRVAISNALGRRAHKALVLLDYLFKRPVVIGPDVEEVAGVSQPTASALLKDLANLNNPY